MSGALSQGFSVAVLISAADGNVAIVSHGSTENRHLKHGLFAQPPKLNPQYIHGKDIHHTFMVRCDDECTRSRHVVATINIHSPTRGTGKNCSTPEDTNL